MIYNTPVIVVLFLKSELLFADLKNTPMMVVIGMLFVDTPPSIFILLTRIKLDLASASF